MLAPPGLINLLICLLRALLLALAILLTMTILSIFMETN